MMIALILINIHADLLTAAVLRTVPTFCTLMGLTQSREFKDVVFEDDMFDNDSCVTLLCIVVIVTSTPILLISNTTSLNSRQSGSYS